MLSLDADRISAMIQFAYHIQGSLRKPPSGRGGWCVSISGHDPHALAAYARQPPEVN
jgi:hypothetical protein